MEELNERMRQAIYDGNFVKGSPIGSMGCALIAKEVAIDFALFSRGKEAIAAMNCGQSLEMIFELFIKSEQNGK